jgi:hypothetical protein
MSLSECFSIRTSTCPSCNDHVKEVLQCFCSLIIHAHQYTRSHRGRDPGALREVKSNEQKNRKVYSIEMYPRRCAGQIRDLLGGVYGIKKANVQQVST